MPQILHISGALKSPQNRHISGALAMPQNLHISGALALPLNRLTAGQAASLNSKKLTPLQIFYMPNQTFKVPHNKTRYCTVLLLRYIGRRGMDHAAGIKQKSSKFHRDTLGRLSFDRTIHLSKTSL